MYPLRPRKAIVNDQNDPQVLPEKAKAKMRMMKAANMTIRIIMLHTKRNTNTAKCKGNRHTADLTSTCSCSQQPRDEADLENCTVDTQQWKNYYQYNNLTMSEVDALH